MAAEGQQQTNAGEGREQAESEQYAESWRKLGESKQKAAAEISMSLQNTGKQQSSIRKQQKTQQNIRKHNNTQENKRKCAGQHQKTTRRIINVCKYYKQT